MKHIFKILIFVVFLFYFKGESQNAKPNIVVLMADDIGVGDISFYHKQRTNQKPAVNTPNIDDLIKEGIRFSDAHSPASLCAPTRFSMLTGNYSYRNSRPWGVWTPEADALIDANNYTTSARIAKKGGYATAFFGKWGLGGTWVEKKPDYTKLSGGALSYGFDYACELPEGIQNRPFAFYENRTFMKLKPNSVITEISAEQTGYTDSKKHNDRGGMGDSNWDPSLAGGVLASKAVNYIEKQTASKSKGPFFMYYCSQAVHIPHAPPKELNGEKIAGSTPGVHGDMIRELDVQVGLIVAALKKAGVYENTLFIFTSDNGGLSFDKDMTKAGHDTSNGLSGSKGSIMEGGHRVPFIAVWPKEIKPNTESHEPIVGLDVVATIAALSGQPLDRKVVVDSSNLIPYLTGKSSGSAHKYLIHQSAGGPTYAIREGEWKLIMGTIFEKGAKKNKNLKGELGIIEPIALYNLKENLSEDESKNLVKNPKFQEKVKLMFEKYKELRTTGGTTLN